MKYQCESSGSPDPRQIMQDIEQVKEDKKVCSLKVCVNADMSQIDEAISKIKELKDLLGSLEINLTIKR